MPEVYTICLHGPFGIKKLGRLSASTASCACSPSCSLASLASTSGTLAKILGTSRNLGSPSAMIRPFYVCMYIYIYTHTHMYLYMYIFIYLCILRGRFVMGGGLTAPGVEVRG